MMHLASNVLSAVLSVLKRLLTGLIGVLALALLITGCNGDVPTSQADAIIEEPTSFFSARPVVKQVDTPDTIRELSPFLDKYEPQIQIRSPKPEQVLDETSTQITIRVRDLPIYKDEIWELGPHLDLILDNQLYQSIYDLENPIRLTDLTPGTHTLRVVAMRPWQESFKNDGAYDQVTFHVLTETDEHTPDQDQPLLTYIAPNGTIGAEPVLLDFYLTNAPLHEVAQDNPEIADWHIRYTINGDSLTLKEWQPIYIEGLKPGNNWVQATLVDETETPIPGIFNNTARLIKYDPGLDDSLTQLVKGTVTVKEVGSIVDPNYVPPAPVIEEPEVSEPAIAPVVPTPSEPLEAKPENPEADFSDTSDVLTELEDENGVGENGVKDRNFPPSNESTTTDEEGETAQGEADAASTEIVESAPTISETTTPAAESEPERIIENIEESDLPDQDGAADPGEPESIEPENAEPAAAQPASEEEDTIEMTTDAETVENPEVTDNTEASDNTKASDNTEASEPGGRRYFKRLYDYRDRKTLQAE